MSPNPIGPGFKKTDLKAGMRISFPYQNQLYKGTIDGFNVIEGREILYVDGVAYRYSDMELKPTYMILVENDKKDNEPVEDVEIKEKRKIVKAKKTAGFKLVKRLTKK